MKFDLYCIISNFDKVQQKNADMNLIRTLSNYVGTQSLSEGIQFFYIFLV
jgi:hypothetical protein